MRSDQLLKKNIGEEFKCVGQWWLPTESDPTAPPSKQGGTLTFFRDGGTKLEVTGRLQGDKLPEKLVGRPVEIIWGISTEGELLTLVECQNVETSIGSIWTETYLIGNVFVSNKAWFTLGEDIRFKALLLQYTHLAEWVGKSGFQPPSLDKFDKFIKNKKAEIKFSRPDDIKPIQVGDYAVSIRFGNSWPSMGPAIQEATIKQYTWISVEPRNAEAIALDDALVLVRGIQDFLTLMMYPNPVYPLVIEGKVETEEKKVRTWSQTLLCGYSMRPPRLEGLLRH